MSFFPMTDHAVAEEMGRRLNALRLRKNLSQKEVAASTGLSLKAIQTAESGGSKLLTYIKILRVLNSLDSLESFLPDIGISPLQLAKAKGKQRQRASGSRKK
ncbi:helix-turn-helix domain-containing protein [Desulfoluna sp.]|uniref:helix-turn-helix transcriptional regulator n=1 Tax=Desulfoluna sp. TaxID=2045199 RepID=UPI00260FF844|nr:helix-turn-helix domain-containing protein [Desulfoluna sp.]